MTTSQTTDPKGIATIALSPRIFVQGVFVRWLDGGRILIRVGDEDFAGHPVDRVNQMGRGARHLMVVRPEFSRIVQGATTRRALGSGQRG